MASNTWNSLRAREEDHFLSIISPFKQTWVFVSAVGNFLSHPPLAPVTISDLMVVVLSNTLSWTDAIAQQLRALTSLPSTRMAALCMVNTSAGESNAFF